MLLQLNTKLNTIPGPDVEWKIPCISPPSPPRIDFINIKSEIRMEID